MSQLIDYMKVGVAFGVPALEIQMLHFRTQVRTYVNNANTTVTSHTHKLSKSTAQQAVELSA